MPEYGEKDINVFFPTFLFFFFFFIAAAAPATLSSSSFHANNRRLYQTLAWSRHDVRGPTLTTRREHEVLLASPSCPSSSSSSSGCSSSAIPSTFPST